MPKPELRFFFQILMLPAHQLAPHNIKIKTVFDESDNMKVFMPYLPGLHILQNMEHEAYTTFISLQMFSSYITYSQIFPGE